VDQLPAHSFVPWSGPRLGRGRIRLLYSEGSLDDLAGVLMRPKLARHMEEADVELMFQRIKERGKRIMVRSDVRVCRDPDDDHLLALCKDGRADLLITGDKDLLVLKHFGATRILSPTEFLREHP